LGGADAQSCLEAARHRGMIHGSAACCYGGRAAPGWEKGIRRPNRQRTERAETRKSLPFIAKPNKSSDRIGPWAAFTATSSVMHATKAGSVRSTKFTAQCVWVLSTPTLS
jgi:hypothetical protein